MPSGRIYDEVMMSTDEQQAPAGVEHVDADKQLLAGHPPPSSAVRLDRDRIVDAAIEHIDRDGLATLTMRRLGEALGVEAMSLYRYVPSKDNLLDAVVERLVGRMQQDDHVPSTPQDGWQDFLQRLAHGIRRVALAHPKAFPLIASRPVQAPWLRPPLRSLEWVEAFLGGLRQEGFDDAAAVAGYRAFTSFLLGHLLLEVASLGADLGPLDVIEDATPDPQGLSSFPMVEELRHDLSKNRSDVEFEESLENLLERINLMRTAAPPPS